MYLGGLKTICMEGTTASGRTMTGIPPLQTRTAHGRRRNPTPTHGMLRSETLTHGMRRSPTPTHGGCRSLPPTHGGHRSPPPAHGGHRGPPPTHQTPPRVPALVFSGLLFCVLFSVVYNKNDFYLSFVCGFNSGIFVLVGFSERFMTRRNTTYYRRYSRASIGNLNI
jgi:hypothetical protein